jgi:hypothetical protein
VLVSNAGFAVYAQDTDGRTLLLVSGDASRSVLADKYRKLEGAASIIGNGAAFAIARSVAGVSGIIMDLTSFICLSSPNLVWPSHPSQSPVSQTTRPYPVLNPGRRSSILIQMPISHLQGRAWHH